MFFPQLNRKNQVSIVKTSRFFYIFETVKPKQEESSNFDHSRTFVSTIKKFNKIIIMLEIFRRKRFILYYILRVNFLFIHGTCHLK